MLLLLRDLAVGLRLHQLAGGVMSPISVSMHSTSYASIATSMSSNASRWRSAARRQELEHRVLLRRVAEVVADRRLQHVVHQVLHRADARDHARRILHTDVDDLRHVEVEREAVARAHRDRDELRVVVMRLGARGPVQHDVRGRHELTFIMRVLIGCLPGSSGVDPHALAAALARDRRA